MPCDSCTYRGFAIEKLKFTDTEAIEYLRNYCLDMEKTGKTGAEILEWLDKNIGACVSKMIEHGKSQKQAVAICMNKDFMIKVDELTVSGATPEQIHSFISDVLSCQSTFARFGVPQDGSLQVCLNNPLAHYPLLKQEREKYNLGDKKEDSKTILTYANKQAEFLVAIDRVYEDAKGFHIHGTLTAPRLSLNGWLYLPEELAAQDGHTVPLFIEHEEMKSNNYTVRGEMTVKWNGTTQDLEYDAIVTDKEAIDGVKKKKYRYTSMGAKWDGFDLVRGYQFPKGVQILEGSLVENPGIPNTTSVHTDAYMIDYTNGGVLLPLNKCTTDFCKSIRSSLITDVAKDKATMTEKIPNETKDETKPETTVATDSTKKEETKTETPKPEVKADEKPADPKKEADKDVVNVKIDASEVSKVLKESIDEMRKIQAATPKTDAKPQGKVLTGTEKSDIKKKFYGIITDSLKNYREINWTFVKGEMAKDNIGLDAIGLTEVGTAAGAQWLEDLYVIPGDLSSNRIREACDVVTIERGAKEVHFTLIATPAVGDGTAPTVPSDATQTITDVIATPAERVVKQRITDTAVRTTSVNLAAGIATSFRIAESIDEDDKVLTAVNAITAGNLAAQLFGGNATTEATIDTADTFDHKLLAKAKRAIGRKGYGEAYIPGMLKCVMSPEQMEQLMGDSGIQRFIEWVAEGEALKVGIIPRLHGIDLIVAGKTPIVDGSPTTLKVHRAYVWIKGACGLAFTKDLAIESVRYPEERATTIVGTYEIAAKVKKDDMFVRISTYGSGS